MNLLAKYKDLIFKLQEWRADELAERDALAAELAEVQDNFMVALLRTRQLEDGNQRKDDTILKMVQDYANLTADYEGAKEIIADNNETMHELKDECGRLRDALLTFDALIKHQYTGTQEAMSDLTYAAQNAARVLGELE